MKQQSTPAPTEASTPGFSIVICCYNSAKRLPQTIAALGRLSAAGYAVEVLVVDNASKDDTSAVALAALSAPGFSHSSRVLYEAEPGKSHALGRAFRESRNKYVVIVDDDNWLAPDYLDLAWNLMEADASIGVLGGTGEPVCEGTPPAWFPRFAIDYAAAPQAACSGDVTRTNRYLYGAGMVLRKAAWDDVLGQGFTSLVTEVRGSKPSGEDNEMCYALIFNGYKIWYDSRLRFQHVIPSQRLTWQYLRQTYRVNATAHVELRPWVHFLELSPTLPNAVPPLIWLRNGLYMLRYLLPFLGRALRRGELGQEGSADSLRAFYYWHSFVEYCRKELRRDPGFHQARQFISRLRTRHPLTPAP